MSENKTPNQPQDSSANSVGVSELLGGDSKSVYILCHLMSAIYNAAVVAGFIYLSSVLDNGWVLLPMLFCIRGYKHDFNRLEKLKGSD